MQMLPLHTHQGWAVAENVVGSFVVFFAESALSAFTKHLILSNHFSALLGIIRYT